MCIVLATTAHPSYSLIVIDNRDEFLLRPTSRPHWWPSHHQEILSARDLYRSEQGTWLGITRTGKFAVLTNFREDDSHDAEHPVQGLKSRGGMVTAWLTSPDDESTEAFVHRLLQGDGVKGVGGFSLVCGKLRRRHVTDQEIEPVAIISNRSGSPKDVPWIAERRGEVYGLSNTSYDDPITWPKVRMGKEKVLQAVEGVVSEGLGEEELVEKLYSVLDYDTLPHQEEQDFEASFFQLRESIFIRSIGKETSCIEMPQSDQNANSNTLSTEETSRDLPQSGLHSSAEASNGLTGVYGTQRQTILLVDWNGNVTFRERSLYDDKGRSIERGSGDMKFQFRIQGWEGESKGNEVRPLARL